MPPVSISPSIVDSQNYLSQMQQDSVARTSRISETVSHYSNEFFEIMNPPLLLLPTEAEQQLACQNILGNSEACNQFLKLFTDSFIKSKKKKRPVKKNEEKGLDSIPQSDTQSSQLSTSMIKSDAGATGFTFLCTSPALGSGGLLGSMLIPFVIKWQNAHQCTVERLGSKIFKIMSFNAPQIVSPDKVISKRLANIATTKFSAMASMPTNYEMIAMPQMLANTLLNAIKINLFQSLSPTEIQNFMEVLGAITAIDLLIGNNDRGIKFTSDSLMPLMERPLFNAGNLMLYIVDGELKDIYTIDNCPPSDLIDRVYAPIDDAYGGIESFLDLEDEVKDGDPRIVSEDVFNQKIQGYHEVFQYLILNPDKIINHVTENLIKCILDGSVNFVDQNSSWFKSLTGSEQRFARGMKKKIDEVKAYDFNTFLSSLETRERTETYAKRFIKLLELNYNFIKNLKD